MIRERASGPEGVDGRRRGQLAERTKHRPSGMISLSVGNYQTKYQDPLRRGFVQVSLTLHPIPISLRIR